MPSRPFKSCSYPGCPELVQGVRYCLVHEERERKRTQKIDDSRRGSSTSRGYNSRWSRASKAFLARPENQFCKLRLPGCTDFADTTDHIDPVDGANDPKFWDRDNWQASCAHCNRLKGHRNIKGEGFKGEGFK